ncbi:MAG: tRNA 2-thiouridine(34) synthase MnmA [Deltaproteobacteria bacterium]|nr:tRNA 2-thiouridine(34) synthase MnmA [Deltaproteobacteria bacterium]
MAIAVLVSGGVDSAVALARLVRAHGPREVVAFYLKIWLEDELAFLGSCPWEEDLRYARATAALLGVPLEVVPLQRRYHEAVVARAVAELARGRTPSPDLHCNTEIKYGAFVEAVGAGFERVATGHYARVAERAGRRVLLAARDPVKDQTYFLSRLAPEQLARALVPIGDLTKAEVRAEAAALGLPPAERPDSQGICFLGKIPYPAFVRAHLGDSPGPIVDVDTGRTLGEHRGLWFHTIGQRQGLGLGGGPWFVVDKDVAGRALRVAHASRLAAHRRVDLEIEDLRWPGGEAAWARATTLKLRHGPARLACRVEAPDEDDGHVARLRVRLAEPEPGVAPGQFVVLYDGDVCLGSGVIR